jgi:hypothetical protein
VMSDYEDSLTWRLLKRYFAADCDPLMSWRFVGHRPGRSKVHRWKFGFQPETERYLQE